MDLLQAAALFAAAILAGALNAMVGSGTLITFPTVLALGYPPVVANMSNTVGLVPGVLSGAYGYRRELVGQGRRLVTYGIPAVIGGILGTVLLLQLPSDAFEHAVPALILGACALVALQPRLNRWLKERNDGASPTGPALFVGLLAAGVYGGYFGAALGIILVGLFGIFLPDRIQRVTAMKNVMTTLVNGIAAIVFIAAGDVNWAVAGVIAAGSSVGGLLGARIGLGLSPTVLRAIIVTVGLVASVIVIAGLF